MAEEQYFCMIHEGRCGSTVLASLLSQHTGIVHFNEILTRGSWVSPEFAGSELEKRRDALEIRLPNLCDFVREVARTRKAQDKLSRIFVGFEIKLNQLSHLQLACDLSTLVTTLDAALGGVNFIFLTRRNILRRHVSTLRCLYKNVTHAKAIENVNFEKVTIAGDTMRDWSYDFTRLHPSLPALLEASENQRHKVRDYAAAHSHLYMEYEDFEYNPLAGAQRIMQYLGLPCIEAKSPLLKTGNSPLADLLDNYDQVRSELESTRWLEMLD